MPLVPNTRAPRVTTCAGRGNPRGGGGWEQFAYTVAAAGYAGWSADGAVLGPELAASVRIRSRSWPGGLRSFWDQQLGDYVEVSLHGRVLGGVGTTTSRKPEWMLGGSLCLPADARFQNWIWPMPLCQLLPEVGAAWFEGVTRAYLGWRIWPMQYRLSSVSERQRPYALGERLAFDLSPTLLLTLGDSPRRWTAGLSFGATLW